MPDQKHTTIVEENGQGNGNQDDWEKEVVPRLPAYREEQAKKLKAFERSREISSATDLLRGLLAYVYTAHSFQQLSMWSLLIGLADVSANDWRKRLQKASVWLDWLLQEVLANAGVLSPWLARAGVRRIYLIDGTHWKCLGPKGMVWRVHTAFDLLAGRLSQLKVTDQSVGEHLEIFELQEGDLVVTDRANGLRERIVWVKEQLAHIIVRFSPHNLPLEDEQAKPIDVVGWLKGRRAKAGQVCSREVWVNHKGKRVSARCIGLRLSQEQRQKAERRTKRAASKKQYRVRPETLYVAGWVLLITTLPKEHWSDLHVLRLYQARWHIELLFKRIKQLLKRQSLRCKTAATAKPTLTLLLLGWALVEQESAAIRLAMRDALHCAQLLKLGKPLSRAELEASWWQDDLDVTLSEWILAEACFDLLCQQIRGSYTAERFRACLPRLQRFLGSGHRKRPHLYTQVCHWLGVPAARPEDGDRAMIA
jgi:hypothetical protein